MVRSKLISTKIEVNSKYSSLKAGHGDGDDQLHDTDQYRGGTARGAQTVKFWVKYFYP